MAVTFNLERVTLNPRLGLKVTSEVGH